MVRLEVNERAERLRRVVLELCAAGITSANGLAKALNERHVATARGHLDGPQRPQRAGAAQGGLIRRHALRVATADGATGGVFKPPP